MSGGSANDAYLTLGIIALLLVTVGGGLALVIVTLVRRSRARTRSSQVP